jgi:hypothetical protein
MPVASQGLVQRLHQSLHLADVHRRGDDKVVSEGRDLAYVKKQHVFRLLLGQQVNDTPRELSLSQKAPSRLSLGAL